MKKVVHDEDHQMINLLFLQKYLSMTNDELVKFIKELESCNDLDVHGKIKEGSSIQKNLEWLVQVLQKGCGVAGEKKNLSSFQDDLSSEETCLMSIPDSVLNNITTVPDRKQRNHLLSPEHVQNTAIEFEIFSPVINKPVERKNQHSQTGDELQPGISTSIYSAICLICKLLFPRYLQTSPMKNGTMGEFPFTSTDIIIGSYTRCVQFSEILKPVIL